MYAVTSIPFVSRTRATLRSAEFGFLGVTVYTRVHTPRRWGAATRRLRPLPDFSPGVASFLDGALRPLRTSWLVVGMRRTMIEKSARRDRRERLVDVAVLQPRGLGHRKVGDGAGSHVDAWLEARDGCHRSVHPVAGQ